MTGIDNYGLKPTETKIKGTGDIKILTDANVDKFSLMLECHKETGFSNADTVTTQTIADTSGVKFVAKLTNFSDGTGETLVKKIDDSEVTFMTKMVIERYQVWYSINTSNAKSAVEINMGRYYKIYCYVIRW